MIEITNCPLPNIGFIKAKLTNEEFLPILDEVKNIYNNFDTAVKHNQYLAGHIEKEYQVIQAHDHIESLALNLIKHYNPSHSSIKDDLFMAGAWINFQKKYEYNPIHSHDGLYSFVIYVSIPYMLKDEISQIKNIPAKDNVIGKFCFHYTDTLGKITSLSLDVDQTWERTMILFPADMYHSVNPFYSSDEYRISVAGNIYASDSFRSQQIS